MRNPFILNIYPEFFVGYEIQKNNLLSAIKSNEKYILISGEIGVGKTTMARWLLKEKRGVYFPRPPKNIDELIKHLKKSTITKLFNKIFNSGENEIIVIDEFHEAKEEFIKDLRSYMDMLNNINVIFIIIPEFKSVLREKYPSLYSRITTEINLTKLNKNETYQLIKQRIQKFGGNGIEPFTSDAIEVIYEESKGIPREILKVCSYYYKISQEKKIEIIDKSIILAYKTKEVKTYTPTTIKEKKEINKTTITPKQKEVIDLIKKHGKLTTPEIVSLIDKKSYSSDLHALRAVNNILRKLESEKILKRKREGRRYVYYIE